MYKNTDMVRYIGANTAELTTDNIYMPVAHIFHGDTLVYNVLDEDGNDFMIPDELLTLTLRLEMDEPEMVNHPAHYNTGKYEVIDVIEDWKLGFNLGNTVKYLARAEHKSNQIEDLEKAAFYLNRQIELIKHG